VLGEHDQGRAGGVEPRVHAGGDLDPPRQRQTDVDAVEHRVRLECAADLLDDLRTRGDDLKRERSGRIGEPIEVLLEPEDAARVQPQSLPHGIAALHDRIEWAHRGLVAMHQSAADVDDQVAVAVVEALQHADSQAVSRWRQSLS
jgi:hypothetical protein